MRYNKFNKSTNEPGRWIRLGACTLILGASSLLMTAGEAFAISTSVSSTLTGNSSLTPIFVDPSNNKTLVNSLVNVNFTVINQGGIKLGDGINEFTIGIFDFTSEPDWGLFVPRITLTSANLMLTLTARNDKFVTDPFQFDSAFTVDGEVTTGTLTDIFLFAPFTPGPGLPLTPHSR